jgi:hypothetical protein
MTIIRGQVVEAKQKKSSDTLKNEVTNYLAIYLGCGVAIGPGIGLRIDSYAIGTGLGIAIGLGLWAVHSRLEDRK